MAGDPSPQAEVKTLGAAARREAAALAAHARSLDVAGWEAPSWCVGWSVREVVAHLAEGMDRFGQQVWGALAGEPVEFTMPERDARRAQVKALPTAELPALLERNTAAFFDHVEGLAADDLTRPLVPMAAGLTPIRQVAQLRLAELALHRWDVRVPTDPAAPVDAEAAGLLVDWVLGSAPRQAKREALEGVRATIHCDTSGRGGGPLTLAAHNGAVEACRGAPGSADATIYLPVEAWTRLVWGRLPRAELDSGAVRIEGDREAVLALWRAFGSR
jgi:uncharacterized protein (TIGR03083 family)